MASIEIILKVRFKKSKQSNIFVGNIIMKD